MADLGKELPSNIVFTVVVAQLAERSLPTPDIRGSNPDIDNKIFKSANPEKTKIE